MTLCSSLVDVLIKIYTICQYEKAWHVYSISPWCAVFSEDEIKVSCNNLFWTFCEKRFLTTNQYSPNWQGYTGEKMCPCMCAFVEPLQLQAAAWKLIFWQYIFLKENNIAVATGALCICGRIISFIRMHFYFLANSKNVNK